jgi:uncharacterized protein YqhQ
MGDMGAKAGLFARASLTSLELWTSCLFAADERDLKAEKIPVGGQAVIEGVLMKGPKQWGLAVRQPSGGIFKEKWTNSSMTTRYPWKLPILRGVVTMAEMMRVGFRALGRSAEIALEETDEEFTKKDIFLAVTIGIAAVVGLFIALPMWLGDGMASRFALSATMRNAAEGAMRGVVFVGYVACIGLMKDIRQVFRYHGAEHKTINAYEKINPKSCSGEGGLMPETIIRESRIHPRCGTSFLLVAILIGIAVFSVIGKGGILWRVGSRVALLPLVIGVSYEIIRFAARSGFVGWLLMSPMLSLQYLTTREPDMGQVEVALASLNVALERE